MSDHHQPAATNVTLLTRHHGPLYERLEAITPTPVKAGSKRVYHRVRRRYNRWRFIDRERLVEFGYRFRYDRRAPYTTRVGARTIAEDFNVWSASLGDIVVGRRCWFGLNNVIMGPVEIGDDLSTGQFVEILGPRGPSPRDDQHAREKTTIGRNVWISSGAIVLFGVEIGDNAVISAGAIVSEDVPPNTLYVQRPRALYLPLDETHIRRPERS
jgi:Hexapeptide repeat of succinyl-transferase